MVLYTACYCHQRGVQIVTGCRYAVVYANAISVPSYHTSQLTDALVCQQMLAT